jgi:hypothetical protein
MNIQDFDFTTLRNNMIDVKMFDGSTERMPCIDQGDRVIVRVHAELHVTKSKPVAQPRRVTMF